MTKPIKDKLIESDEQGFLYESGFYWADCNHSGTIFISKKMVEKFSLVETDCDCEPIEEFFYGWSDEDKEDYKNYDYSLWISHSDGWSKTKAEGENGTNDETPHGDIADDEFVMWFNSLPFELLSEPKEDVMIYGWRDG